MATQIIETIFQFKRGTAARWAEVNPVLMQAEPGFEIDTGKLKVGNGQDKYLDLPYVGAEDISIAADGLSVVINQVGEIALAGFEEAKAGQILRKTETGTLEWFTPIVNIEDLNQIETIELYGGSAVEVL